MSCSQAIPSASSSRASTLPSPDDSNSKSLDERKGEASFGDARPRRRRTQRQEHKESSRRQSSSSLPPLSARIGDRKDDYLEAQRLLSSMALSRPTPYGIIPQRAAHTKRQGHDHEGESDLRLSPSDAFDFQPGLDVQLARSVTSASYDVKGKGKVPSSESLSTSPSQASLPQSPISPAEEWEQSSSDAPHEGGRSIRIAREPPRRGSAEMSTSRSRESTGQGSADTTPCSSRSSSLPRKPSLLRQNISPPSAVPIATSATVTATSLSGAHHGSHNATLLSFAASMDDEEKHRGRNERLLSSEIANAAVKVPDAARAAHIKAHMISTSTDSAQTASNAPMPSLYSLSRGRSAHVSPSRRWDRRGASASVLCSTALPLDLQFNADELDEDEATLHEDSFKRTFALERDLSDSTAKRRTFLHPSTAEHKISEADDQGVSHLDTALFGSDDDGDMLDSDISDGEASVAGTTGRSVDSGRSSSRAASRAASEGRELTSSLASSRRSSIDPERRRELKILLDRDTPSRGRRASSSTTSSHGVAAGSLSMSMTHGSSDVERSGDATTSRTPPVSSSATQALGSLFRRRPSKSSSTPSLQITHLSPPKLEAIAAGDTPREELTPLPESDASARDLGSGSTTVSEPRPLREKASLSTLKDVADDPLLGTGFGSVDDSIEVEAIEWADEQRPSDVVSTLSPIGSPAAEAARKLTAAEQEDQRKKGFAAAYQQRLYSLSSRFWGPSGQKADAQEREEISAEIDTVAAAPAAPAPSGLLASGWRHLAGLPNLLLMPTLGYGATSRRDSSSEPTAAEEESGKLASKPVDDAAHGALKSEALHAAQVAVAQFATAPHHMPGTATSKPALSSAGSEAVGRALASAHSLQSTAATKDDESAVDDDVLPEENIRPQSKSRKSSSSQTQEAKPPQDLPQQLQPISLAKRSRGVLTPQEADADISAYVAGLGLPIDPDVELSSVVHLQTFRTERHDAKEQAQPQRVDGKTPSPHASTPVSRQSSNESRARPEERARRDVAKEDTRPHRDMAKEQAADSKRRSAPRERSHTDGGVIVHSKCARPAVGAPVPGNFSAYNSEESSEESIVEEEERGRRRPRQRRRPSPPPKQQQCAIGLFASSPYTRERSGKSGRHSGRSSATGQRSNRSSRQTSPESGTSATLLRIRSTPNLTNLVPAVDTKMLSPDDPRSRENSESGEDSDERSTRRSRGRTGGVKRVSLSRGGVHHEQAPAHANPANAVFPTSIMAGSAATAAAAAASHDGAPGVGEIQQLGPDVPGGANAPAVSASAASPPTRLPPIVGASGMPHFAGRPSMVSNGAHLLMLSLELEMMRNSKITGSLKPRWLKARMRTEPYGPAAIIASVARERQLQQQRQQQEQEEGCAAADTKDKSKPSSFACDESPSDIEMSTSPSDSGKSRMSQAFEATRPKRGSALRFEVEASVSAEYV